MLEVSSQTQQTDENQFSKFYPMEECVNQIP